MSNYLKILTDIEDNVNTKEFYVMTYPEIMDKWTKDESSHTKALVSGYLSQMEGIMFYQVSPKSLINIMSKNCGKGQFTKARMIEELSSIVCRMGNKLDSSQKQKVTEWFTKVAEGHKWPDCN